MRRLADSVGNRNGLVFDLMGNNTGVEAPPLDDLPTMRYADGMSNVAGFTGRFAKNFALGVVQGGIGFASDAVKGWDMIYDMGFNGGRNIDQIDQFNLRPFQYDPGVGQFGGGVGEMLSPAATMKAAKLGVAGVRWLAPTFDTILSEYTQKTGIVISMMPEGPSFAGGANSVESLFNNLPLVKPRSLNAIDPAPGQFQLTESTLGKLSTNEPYIYVIDAENGVQVAARGSAGASGVKHTQLSGGAAVRGAGELIMTNENTVLINNLSGRYRAQAAEAVTQMQKYLEQMKLNVNVVKHEF